LAYFSIVIGAFVLLDFLSRYSVEEAQSECLHTAIIWIIAIGGYLMGSIHPKWEAKWRPKLCCAMY